MPPENSTQGGTASEVRTNANSQELFAVTRTTETRNVLLVVIGIFASACFTTVLNMPAKLLKENYPDGKSFRYVKQLINYLAIMVSSLDSCIEDFIRQLAKEEGHSFQLLICLPCACCPSQGITLQAMDVIYDGLPDIVYVLVFNSSLLVTCMAVIVILGWRLQFRSVLLFLVISLSLVYIILANKIMPTFRVRIGKSNISSVALMWLSVVAFTLYRISTLSFGKYPLKSIWRFLFWLWAESTNYWRNTVHWLWAKTIYWRNTLRNWNAQQTADGRNYVRGGSRSSEKINRTDIFFCPVDLHKSFIATIVYDFFVVALL